MRLQAQAKELLTDWRGADYSFGPGCLEDVASHALALGGPVLVVASQGRWLRSARERVQAALLAAGVEMASPEPPVPGASANAPEANVLRIARALAESGAATVVAIGGGSTIDAVKAALPLATVGGGAKCLHSLFGTGQVSAQLAARHAQLPKLVAAQTAASSAAHLTKYANVTLPEVGQKKLIVDPALIPQRAVFDYDLTVSAPASLVGDGAFDGMAHCVEVLWGAAAPTIAEEVAAKISDVSLCGLELLVKYLPIALREGAHPEAGVALGLGTDLGGYAIMLGGTNGPHLNSFSLVDVAPHGRACAILNPYWTVFFAPAIEGQLRAVGEIYQRYGYLAQDLAALTGRDLGVAVARAMIRFAESVGYPTTLAELPGFAARYIDQALLAASDPQLSMKLRNMPIALTTAEVDRYMGPILRAALTGDLDLVRDYGL